MCSEGWFHEIGLCSEELGSTDIFRQFRCDLVMSCQVIQGAGQPQNGSERMPASWRLCGGR